MEDLDGNICEYGILEILEKAHNLRAISVSSPLIEYGIYRLLIAFLTDALRPKSMTDLKSIYFNGMFPGGLFNQYIRDCERREQALIFLIKKSRFFSLHGLKNWITSQFDQLHYLFMICRVATIQYTMITGSRKNRR